MHRHFIGITGIFLLFLVSGVLLAGCAAAVEITESPDHVLQGDLVTLSVRGLPNQSTFSLDIQGTFFPRSGDAFTFQTSHFVMPFTLKNGEIHATVDNTKEAFLEVTKGDQMASVGKSTVPDGRFSYAINRSITAGTYDALTLKGAARDSSQPVTTDLQLTGIKTGPNEADITFNVDGIESGTLHVTIYVDGNEELSQDIVIGTPAASSPVSGETSPENTPGNSQKTPWDCLLVIPSAVIAFAVYTRVRGDS